MKNINYFDTPLQRRQHGNRTVDLISWIVYGNKCSVCGVKENFIPEMKMCSGCFNDSCQDQEMRYGEEREITN